MKSKNEVRDELPTYRLRLAHSLMPADTLAWCLLAHASMVFCIKHPYCSEGVLPLVVAYLDQDKTGFIYGATILQHLCSSHIDTCHEHADLLASLRGVLRVSNAMCSVQACKADMKASGMSTRLML